MWSRSSHSRCSARKGVLRNFTKFTGKHHEPATLLKRDSSTGVFLWILRSFQEHLFHRAPLDDCFSYIIVSMKYGKSFEHILCWFKCNFATYFILVLTGFRDVYRMSNIYDGVFLLN